MTRTMTMTIDITLLLSSAGPLGGKASAGAGRARRLGQKQPGQLPSGRPSPRTAPTAALFRMFASTSRVGFVPGPRLGFPVPGLRVGFLSRVLFSGSRLGVSSRIPVSGSRLGFHLGFPSRVPFSGSCFGLPLRDPLISRFGFLSRVPVSVSGPRFGLPSGLPFRIAV